MDMDDKNSYTPAEVVNIIYLYRNLSKDVKTYRDSGGGEDNPLRELALRSLNSDFAAIPLNVRKELGLENFIEI